MKQKFYVVEKKESHVFLYTRENRIIVYDSYEEFLSYLNMDIILRIGKSFDSVALYQYRYFKEFLNPFNRKPILIDEKSTLYVVEKDGVTLDPENIKNDFRKYNLNKRKNRNKKYIKKFIYRKTPVPDTGKRHWYKSYFRHMRTTQERRWSFLGENEDYPIKLRTKRSFKYIPNSWDDIVKERHKNWKKYRKHQYKEN